MNISISHIGPRVAAATIPEFPIVRFESGLLIYEEALINGQYLGASWSAMGRPTSRERVWDALSGNQTGYRNKTPIALRTRQHAFHLQIDGQLLSDRWQWLEGEEDSSSPQGRRESIITLKHLLRPVTVKIHTRLDGSAFLVRWLEIVNTGDRPSAVSEVFPWSGLLWEVGDVQSPPGQAARPFSLGRFRNSEILAEGEFDWESLPDKTLRVENLRGRSGHGCPFFIVRNEVTQEVLVGHFAWSGNWQMEFFNDHEPGGTPVRDTRLYARIGLGGPPPVRVLSPGETVTTPAVHLGYLFGDLDTCVQSLHEHLRRSVVPAQPQGREHLVECNHTGYTVNAQINEAQFLEEVDLAADIGCELFVVDAGWSGATDESWEDVTGDWVETPSLPRGLKPVFQRASELGMLRGLWVEIEAMGRASELLQAHPEWQMKRRGEVIRQLDLAKPEVAQHVEETIIRLVEKYDLDLFRLDYNQRIGEGGEQERDGYAESTMWRYYEALHAVFDRVRQRFPNLLLENCSSGGGRNDLGMMSRFHWTQLSDNFAPAPALKILNGMTMALPPEQCMALFGALDRGVSDIDFMLRIGLFNHFSVSGVFPRMAERNAAARERFRHTTHLFKDFVRPILSTCRVFHHTPIQRSTEPGDWCVLEYAAADASRVYTGVFRLAGAPTDTFHLRPRGLDISLRYRVTFDNTGQSVEREGGELAQAGLLVRLLGGSRSELLLFRAV